MTNMNNAFLLLKNINKYNCSDEMFIKKFSSEFEWLNKFALNKSEEN